MEDIAKMVKSLEDSSLLLKGVSETVQNEVREQKGGLLSMLLGTLGASLLGNILAGKGAITKWQGRGINRAGEGIVRALYGNKSKMDFEVQKYYQNEPGFNGVDSRNNLPKHNSVKKKDEAYVINLDEYSDIETHWVALYVQNNDVTYFDSFWVERIPKEVKRFVGNKNIKTKIFRIQAYDSIMWRYFCIEFIDFMPSEKTLTEFTKLFSSNKF